MLRTATLCALLLLPGWCEADILLNQLGFLPHGAKRAIVKTPATASLEWRLLGDDGSVKATGTSRVFGENAGSGEPVHIVDFSGYTQTGAGLQLAVGEMRSRPFAIAADLYAELKYDALAYFYHNRSGIPIEARYVKDAKWARPAGHAPDIATCFDERCNYKLDASGGWYDAGDQGKYVVNAGISVWTLLNYYERAGAARAAFADGRVSIPERSNGVNDLLDEVRWELKFLLAMQVPTGEELAGMAHHKLHDEHWTPLPTAPHKDTQTRYLYPPSTTATLNFAANAAQCARVWRSIDADFSKRCRAAAERAFAAAVRHPDRMPEGGFTGGGGYGDRDASDEFYWAAAELFVTTGKAAYAQALRASPHFLTADDFSWGKVHTLGTLSLVTVRNSLPAGELSKARANVIAAADRYVEQAKHEGFALPYSATRYEWGSNSAILNHGLLLGVAYDLTRRPEYRDRVIDAMDYMLGRNPLDQSYIAGYGARPMRNAHHRFWAHSLDAAYPQPAPGALSGGPNSSSMVDPVARTMKGTCRPQTCWRDDIRAYSQNEVAINWNAPLFWVAAFLDEPVEGVP